ncbi:hypothetical protein IGI04_027136 [Brassica rapa subsp. trilocularis]|uniref:F-box domain-containing protein n=1 Tax=Brassica rapa subsp. trilocularis TaxID=1813537 RepID=A0ABQ7KY81_BRACM|nr:hypothetical protein IGI04_027136 [Brassica rapa subsp. trilocularis]
MVHRVIEANDSGPVRQTTYLGSRLAVDDLPGSRLAVDNLPGSRLAVDDLPGSRLVNAEVIFAIDFEICNLRQLKVKSSTIIIPLQRQAWIPLDMEENFVRRLLGSPYDFKEVQTTSRKFRRLCQKTLRSSDDFQTTLQEVQTTFRKSRRLPGSPDDFVRRLPRSPDDFQTTNRTLYNKKLPNEEKSDIRTYQNALNYYERETSSKDFQEVQTTSWKSRRLCQKTSKKSRRLPDD